MSTFRELQTKLTNARNKSVVYQHLVDHLEGEFRPHGDESPKKVLLSPDKQHVPDEVIGNVVAELFAGLANVNAEIEQILGSSLAPTTLPPPPTESAILSAPEQEVPSKRNKAAKKEESAS